MRGCGAAEGVNALAVPALAQAPGTPGRAIADVVTQTTEGFRGMLGLATSRPALQTMEWIPRNFKHRDRTAEVLRDFYGAHVEAERAALRGGAEPAADAVAAGRLLWLGPTLLLYSRATYEDDVLAPPVTEVATKGVERANMVRGRLQLAESGQWETLLRAYLADTAAADSADRSRYDRSTTRSLPAQL